MKKINTAAEILFVAGFIIQAAIIFLNQENIFLCFLISFSTLCFIVSKLWKEE